VALFHSVDYLAFPNKSRGTRQQFRKESPAFLLVDRIAHAFKHVGTGGKKGRLLATDVIPRPAGKWGEMVWGLSRWDDSQGGVTLDNERSVDVLLVVRDALDFVEAQVRTNRAA
jgi:hypothetical protein